MGKATEFCRRVRMLAKGGARSAKDPELFRRLSLVALLAWGAGIGRAHLLVLWTRGGIPCVGLPHSAWHFHGGGDRAHDFHHRGQLLADHRGFPGGGGSYLVASKLLTPTLGMASGCALLVDYVLTIPLSIPAGADALFSSLPERLQP